MQLSENTGVFIDQERKESPLSLKFSCPSYIPKIFDGALRTFLTPELLHEEKIDFSKKSFNLAYSHEIKNHLRFFDTITIHEKSKDVICLCNTETSFIPYLISFDEMKRQLFDTKRLAHFLKHGFFKIILKTTTDQHIVQLDPTRHGKVLTVLLYGQISPLDMKYVQLAADRILATGDNSPIEAWAARCKLYVYEKLIFKGEFLEMQVSIAKQVAPKLGNLLELFASEGLDDDDYRETVTAILADEEKISEETYAFCRHITSKFSLDQRLMSFIKRAAWHYVKPELSLQEAKFLDKSLERSLSLEIWQKTPEERSTFLSRERLFSEFRTKTFIPTL
jgi:hypothetical protein